MYNTFISPDATIAEFPHSALNMLSININGLGTTTSTRSLANFIRTQTSKYHITALQEIKISTEENLETLQVHVQNEMEGQVFSNCTIPNTPQHLSPTRTPHSLIPNGGVALIVNSSCPNYKNIYQVHPPPDVQVMLNNRYVCICIPNDTQPVFIHNIYAPVRTEYQTSFYNALPRANLFPSNAQHIVLGDLNTAIDPQHDARTPLLPQHRHIRMAVQAWLLDLNLVDPWRCLHPTLFIKTARTRRVDYGLISEPLWQNAFRSTKYIDQKEIQFGDHMACELKLKPSDVATGTGFWKTPWHLLHIPRVQNYINEKIQELETIIDSERNPGLVWRAFKYRIKLYLQEEQKTRGTRLTAVLKHLKCEIGHLSQKLRSQSNLQLQRQFADAISQYKQLLQYQQEYFKDKAFAKQVRETETSSKFFFRGAKAKTQSNVIKSVKLPDGSVSSRTEDIQQQHLSQWKQVFGDGTARAWREENIPEAQQKILGFITKKLSEVDKRRLDSEIDPKEMEEAIRTSPKGSSPGPDGLPSELYQLNPTAFAKVLTVVFNYQIQRGSFLPGQKKAIVTLLYKKGDPSEPKNYRPICLMQVDMKMLARVLNRRLMSVLPSLIDADQKGFMKKRHIHSNLINVIELQQIATLNQLEMLVQLLDFEKAYDRVDWEYLWSTMRCMNFGQFFIAMLQLCYDGIMLFLNINGILVGPVLPLWGIKQGSPDSPGLFTIAVEALHQMLRASAKTLGIQINRNYFKTVDAFADDTILYAASLAQAIRQRELVHVYEVASNAKLNRSKTKVFLLNKHAQPMVNPPFPIMKARETAILLGVPMGQNVSVEQQVDPILSKYSSRFSKWQFRASTLKGRVLIGHTILYSVLWYATNVVHLSQANIKTITHQMSQYVVNRNVNPDIRKPTLIAAKWLHAPSVVGGLGLIEPQIFIFRNRIRYFQRHLLMPNDLDDKDSGHWLTIPMASFNLAWNAYDIQDTWDFLWLKIYKNGDRQVFANLSLWWQDFFQGWHMLPIIEDWSQLTPEQHSKYICNIPLYKNRFPQYDLFCKPTIKQRQLLAQLLPHQLCTRVGDFLLQDGSWASSNQWIAHVETSLRQCMSGHQKRSLRIIYRKVELLVERECPWLLVNRLPVWKLTQSEWRRWPWKLQISPHENVWLAEATSQQLYPSRNIPYLNNILFYDIPLNK